jgi:hypothetical protein
MVQKCDQAVFVGNIQNITIIITPNKGRANSFSVGTLYVDVLKYSSLWYKSLLGSFFIPFQLYRGQYGEIIITEGSR